MRRIAGGAVTLEPLVAGHATEMFALLGDPAIYEFENEPPPSERWLAERYRRLQSRRSPDGSQQWLNWVIRLQTGLLAGYVQATVHQDGTTLIAYELASRFWRRGIGSEAVSLMMGELASVHGARHFVAILKRANFRSAGLLTKLGFGPAPQALRTRFVVADDEAVMHKDGATHAP